MDLETENNEASFYIEVKGAVGSYYTAFVYVTAFPGVHGNMCLRPVSVAPPTGF